MTAHALLYIETLPDGKRRYVCACGHRGLPVCSIEGMIFDSEAWARGAHRQHAAIASDPTRPPEWGLP